MFFTTSSNSSSDGDRDQLGFRKLFGDNGHRGGARHRVDGGPQAQEAAGKDAAQLTDPNDYDR